MDDGSSRIGNPTRTVGLRRPLFCASCVLAMEFRVGDNARVRGLNSRADLNNMLGTLLELRRRSPTTRVAYFKSHGNSIALTYQQISMSFSRFALVLRPRSTVSSRSTRRSIFSYLWKVKARQSWVLP